LVHGSRVDTSPEAPSCANGSSHATRPATAGTPTQHAPTAHAAASFRRLRRLAVALDSNSDISGSLIPPTPARSRNIHFPGTLWDPACTTGTTTSGSHAEQAEARKMRTGSGQGGRVCVFCHGQGKKEALHPPKKQTVIPRRKASGTASPVRCPTTGPPLPCSGLPASARAGDRPLPDPV